MDARHIKDAFIEKRCEFSILAQELGKFLYIDGKPKRGKRGHSKEELERELEKTRQALWESYDTCINDEIRFGWRDENGKE